MTIEADRKDGDVPGEGWIARRPHANQLGGRPIRSGANHTFQQQHGGGQGAFQRDRCGRSHQRDLHGEHINSSVLNFRHDLGFVWRQYSDSKSYCLPVAPIALVGMPTSECSPRFRVLIRAIIYLPNQKASGSPCLMVISQSAASSLTAMLFKYPRRRGLDQI